DERCVPEADPRSNSGLARAALLRRVAPAKVFPMHAGRRGPDRGAAAYEALLRRRGIHRSGFDFCQLGIGEDGHTASLFPGDPALREKRRLVLHTRAPAGAPDRITLTLPMINRSRLTVFLVAGADKADILARLKRRAGRPALPCELVRPAGRLLLLVGKV
ncbi:MAG: 6-phosphogluconolactonase, partial [Elusimicrobia bacterium]|nr:6-phosphogluconolactonase [Elusimicrobiota bacterium]